MVTAGDILQHFLSLRVEMEDGDHFSKLGHHFHVEDIEIAFNELIHNIHEPVTQDTIFLYINASTPKQKAQLSYLAPGLGRLNGCASVLNTHSSNETRLGSLYNK